MEKKKKLLQMSSELFNYYEERAKEMGVSTANLMVMALQQYVDGQKALQFAGGLQTMITQIEKLKENQ